MFELLKFSDWIPYEGLYAGSGRSEKVWLVSNDEKIGLFKYPKYDFQAKSITTEHISEHLAHQLGRILDIKTATVDIGEYQGRIGSMSYLVNKPPENIIEGINFISGRYPQYNADTMQDVASGEYYCINHLFTSAPFIPKEVWIKMMLFDFIIGNADRHQSNWAVLASKQGNVISVRECPLYDNGSSLCCYVTETQIPRYFQNDPLPLESLVDSKSRSIIRIDGKTKTRPKHSDMVRYLISNYDVAKDMANSCRNALSDETIDDLMAKYPHDILSPQKNTLIRVFLKKKMEILGRILEEL